LCHEKFGPIPSFKVNYFLPELELPAETLFTLVRRPWRFEIIRIMTAFIGFAFTLRAKTNVKFKVCSARLGFRNYDPHFGQKAMWACRAGRSVYWKRIRAPAGIAATRFVSKFTPRNASKFEPEAKILAAKAN
jgi:hypothetical protein